MKKIKIILAILRAGGGIIILEIINRVFDYIYYPIAVYRFSFGKAFVILFVTALILNFILLITYNYLKKDIFGFEKVKLIQEHKNGFWAKVFSMGRIPSIIFLSWYDPFMATVFMSKKSFYVSRLDYLYLFLTTFMGHTLWFIFWSPLKLF